MFKIIAILIVLYIGYAILTGTVHTKSGPGSKTFSKKAEPAEYWFTVSLYLLIAIVTYFYF